MGIFPKYTSTVKPVLDYLNNLLNKVLYLCVGGKSINVAKKKKKRIGFTY
jgi:hypothetical protein